MASQSGSKNGILRRPLRTGDTAADDFPHFLHMGLRHMAATGPCFLDQIIDAVDMHCEARSHVRSCEPFPAFLATFGDMLKAEFVSRAMREPQVE